MPKGQQAHTAVYGIIVKDNKVLLMKRKNTGFRDGFYSIPGGKIDDLELPSTSILRELEEEVNLKLQLPDAQFVMTQHRISNALPCVDFYYLVNKFDESTIKINEPHKCSELKWYDIDNLPYNLLEYVRNAIELHKTTSFLEDNTSYFLDDKKAV